MAVEDLSLVVGPGEILGLAGESGCGKSSVLRFAAGLLAGEGRRRVDGRVGYVPQDLLASLSPYLTVGEQLRDAGGDAGLLEALGLDAARIGGMYPHMLSGGERQRAVVAMAMGGRVLLADEPTAHLDAGAEERVLVLLAERVARTGAGLLIASHSERVFARLGCAVHRMKPAAAGERVAPGSGTGRQLLLVEGVRKEYWRRDWRLRTRVDNLALDGVSLTVEAGETVALMGDSGAGKSSLARCIAGREAVTAGSIAVAGPVQLVPQEPSESLNRRMTIGACLREACGRAEAEMLEPLGLPGAWLERRTGELSEGQRARVAIARSVEAVGDGLLILDESLSGLDPATRGAVLAHIGRVQARTGMGCLVITHDPEVAAACATRTVRIARGRTA